MRRFSLCLIFVLSCSLPSARTFAADKWIHATSPHFDMYAAESEADARAALQHLEAVRAYFSAATRSQDPGGRPVRIVVFHSEGDFNKYKPAEYVAAKAYPVAGEHPTIVALGLKPEIYEKIFLEYCEMVMDESAPQLPYWLRAGLAQFYSTLKPGEASIKLGAPPTRAFHTHPTTGVDMPQLVEVQRGTYLASRSKLADDFFADTSSNKALGKGAAATTAMNGVQTKLSQDFEGQTWALTHMLMFSPDYSKKVGELIAAMGSGQDTGTAFNSVYGRSVAQVGTDLDLYMRQSGLAVTTKSFKYENSVPQVEAATKEEQDRIVADLGRKGK
jgi:hypothetical protein